MVYGLPFVGVTLYANSKMLRLAQVLLDTGSGASVFRTDDLEKLDLFLEPTDVLRTMRGIGGVERIIEKSVTLLEVGTLKASPFIVQMGALEYGFAMDGILGADFLLATRAVIDFETLEIRKAAS